MQGNRRLPDETALRKLKEGHAIQNMALACSEIKSKLIIVGKEIAELREKGSLLREQHLQAEIEKETTGGNGNTTPRSALKKLSVQKEQVISQGKSHEKEANGLQNEGICSIQRHDH